MVFSCDVEIFKIQASLSNLLNTSGLMDGSILQQELRGIVWFDSVFLESTSFINSILSHFSRLISVFRAEARLTKFTNKRELSSILCLFVTLRLFGTTCEPNSIARTKRKLKTKTNRDERRINKLLESRPKATEKPNARIDRTMPSNL